MKMKWDVLLSGDDLGSLEYSIPKITTFIESF